MKLFVVAPSVALGADQGEIGLRSQDCVGHIADLILQHVWDDPALFGMRHKGETSQSPLAMTMDFGYAEAVPLTDKETLREALVACGDANSGKWMLIRSLVTCRSVFYGFDGQAFVCLPHDASPIVSPDPAVIEVSDRSELLIETDWLDGLQVL